VVVIGIMIAAFDEPLFQRCLGEPLEIGGRGGAMIRMAVAEVCSPMMLRGSAGEWLLFALLWAPIPFAVLNWRWAKRHTAYWNGVRQRETERRAEKQRAKIAARKSESDPA